MYVCLIFILPWVRYFLDLASFPLKGLERLRFPNALFSEGFIF